MSRGMVWKFRVVVILLAGGILAGWPGPGAAFTLFKHHPDVPTIKVMIESGQPEIGMGAARGFTIFSDDGRKRKVKSRSLVVAVEREGLTVRDSLGRVYVSGVQELRMEPSREGMFFCRGRKYRGWAVLMRTSAGIKTVNELDVEDYLKGVVPREMGILGPGGFEALKAQAVAARTYALYRLQKELIGHLEATVMDQVYGGTAAEYELSNQAVEATRGEVLWYNGGLIKAYYFSTCGGRTAALEEVWDRFNPGCFISVEDTQCRISSNYDWIDSWSRRDLERTLARTLPGAAVGGKTGTLTGIEVVSRSRSGRVDTLAITLDSTVYRVCRDSVRYILRRTREGHPILKSSLFELQVLYDSTGVIDTVKAVGGGSGHGAGMCQWGAIARAQRKMGYQAILKYYYRGVELYKMY
jgi:stage II sporulation protein D